MNILYVSLGILVNFIWGLAFFIPYYFVDIDPIFIALGRYFVYGATALLIICISNPCRFLTRDHWFRAFLFAFAGNVGYYIMLALSIHSIGITVPALIVGMLPVTLVIYGNWIFREFSFAYLRLPILMMVSGIIMLRVFQSEYFYLPIMNAKFWIGIMLAIGALLTWTWYGVSNAKFLKQHSDISNNAWSLAIGVCCLIQSILLFPLLLLHHEISSVLFDVSYAKIIEITIGLMVLGVGVSWLATLSWNAVSRRLPVAVTSMLVVFETISSLIYGYMHDHYFPHPIEFLCILMILLGIWMAVRRMYLLKQSRNTL